MPVKISGNGTITGLSVGGLPDGIVDEDTLANLAVGTGKIANSAVTPAKSTITGGLSIADQFAITSDTANDRNPLTGWYRPSNNSRGSLGSNVTESSGIFTLPTTGFWFIQLFGYVNHNVDERYNQYFLNQSTNSGSSWTRFAGNSSSVGSKTGSSNLNGSACGAVLDVTNAGTFRIKVEINCESNSNNSYMLGNADSNYTTIVFMKLGDT